MPTRAAQSTETTYDGHGRVFTVHKPEWYGTHPVNDKKYTTTYYNADDTVNYVIDPRGARTDYTYENVSGTPKRPLVTAIAYATPNPNPTAIVATPGASWTYDAAGNRTTMSDGLGTVAYTYDELSRLMTETRDFSDNLPNSPDVNHYGIYTLTYTYHLNGSVKSVVDPFGYEVNYSADKLARTTGIGDAGSTTKYATGFSYRAFGGIKTMSLSADHSIDLTMTYDNAQRPATYQAYGNADKANLHSAEYTYNNDGMVAGIENGVSENFDQENTYDFVGRLKFNRVGHLTGTRPYEQTLGYDAFSNLTSRYTTTYSFDQIFFTASYANNRKSWGGSDDQYDVAGNVVESYESGPDYMYWEFDAAGRSWQWRQSGPWGSSLQKGGETKFDGDGRPVKQSELTNTYTVPQGWTGWVAVPAYHIYSSVTGQRITEAQHTGAHYRTNVYMGSADIAIQDSSDVRFKLTDTITGSTRQTNQDGSLPGGDEEETRFELAGLGTNIPNVDPGQVFPPPQIERGGWTGGAERSCSNPFWLQWHHCTWERLEAEGDAYIAGEIARLKNRKKNPQPVKIVKIVIRKKTRGAWGSHLGGTAYAVGMAYSSGSSSGSNAIGPVPQDEDGPLFPHDWTGLSAEFSADDDYLYFDGCSLSYFNARGEIENTWTAVSGHEQKTSRKPYGENVQNEGPLPSSATYLVDPSRIQRRFDMTVVEGTSPMNLKYGIPSNPSNSYKYPNWVPDSAYSAGWGDWRIPLQVASGSVPSNRDGGSFFLHGSTNGWGSAGCLDVGTGSNCAGVLARLEQRRRSIELYVKYTCNPWKTEWAHAAQ